MMRKLLFLSILWIGAQFSGNAHASLLWSHECLDCHNSHTAVNLSNPNLLHYSTSETVCMSCHDGFGAHEVAVHTNGSTFRVTCMECHDPHQSLNNYLGGLNVMMVGFKAVGMPVVDDLLGGGGRQQVAYEERTGTRAFANNELSDGGVRICEACHSISVSAAHSNPESIDCRGCHTHVNSFLGTSPWTDPGVGSCNNCHDAEPVTGSHDRHVRLLGYGCMTCHYSVVFTPDNTLISNGEQHYNGSPSVDSSPAEPFDYDYALDECSNLSCHSDRSWGFWTIDPSILADFNDQGDYGVTLTAGSPVCQTAGVTDPGVCPTPYTYVWDFSDGYSETTYDPVNSIHYEFGVPGPHSVTLTLIASNSKQGSRFMPLDPLPPPPPTPEYHPEATVISGRTVEVSVTTTFGIGVFYVRWGDSTSSNSSGAPVQHTYSGAGTYNIRVEVLDPGHIQYDYEYNVWPPTQTCATCPTLQVTVN